MQDLGSSGGTFVIGGRATERQLRSLNRLTRLLTAAGSLASAGTALAGPLHTLATWAGAVV